MISGSNGSGVDLVGDGIGQNELPASGPTTVSRQLRRVEFRRGHDRLHRRPLRHPRRWGRRRHGRRRRSRGRQLHRRRQLRHLQGKRKGFYALGNVIGLRPGGAGVAAPPASGHLPLLARQHRSGDLSKATPSGSTAGPGSSSASVAPTSPELDRRRPVRHPDLRIVCRQRENLIEENTIVNAELNAVLIKNENNVLTGNLIEGGEPRGNQARRTRSDRNPDRRRPRIRRKRDLRQRWRCDRGRLTRRRPTPRSSATSAPATAASSSTSAPTAPATASRGPMTGSKRPKSTTPN